MDPLSCLLGTGLQNGPAGWNWRIALLWGDGCSYGASCSASVRADEWGGETDKLGHANAAFLGNAVKTLEECSWVAARAYNWGRVAPTWLPLPVSSLIAGIIETLGL